MYLSEQHRIYKGNEYYEMLDGFCFASKNLYNNALFHIRQYYFYTRNIKEGKSVSNLEVSDFVKDYMKDKGSFINYNKLDYLAKKLDNSLTTDYKSMPMASASQSVLKMLDTNWRSFFNSLKRYKLDKKGYLGRPKVPKFLQKDGRYMFILTNQNCKLKDGYVVFPKSFNGFTVKTKVDNLKEVRIVPKLDYYMVEVLYETEEKFTIPENGKYLSIDIGVNNLATITNNFNGMQFIISGKPIKSVNQYYNKNLANYKSLAKTNNDRFNTKHILSLTRNRNDYINTYLHKASKQIVNLAVSYGVSRIIIGYNENWKQESRLSKKVNQSFVQLPFNTFINQIIYKAEKEGLQVRKVNESYTSATDFLADEMPTKENYNKSRRVKRGLFKSDTGRFLNADVNGSYQILKKYLKRNYKVIPKKLKVIRIV